VDANHWRVSDVLSTRSDALGIVLGHAEGEAMAASSKAIARFLDDAKRTSDPGYPLVGFTMQRLTSPSLRAELGLSADDGGARITHIIPSAANCGLLEGDVVLSLDGRKVAKDGTCERPGEGRAFCPGIVFEGHHPGDVIDVGIVRDGSRKSVRVTLRSVPSSSDLVPVFAPNEPAATYVAAGGLVFENLTLAYLGAGAKDWEKTAPSRLTEVALLDAYEETDDKRHVVVLTRVLADPATLGYHKLRDLIVESINGVHLRSLEDVPGAFAHPSGDFDVVTFAPGQEVSRIVLDAKEAEAANGRVRALYHLPSWGN
jgi:hypothetical protein